MNRITSALAAYRHHFRIRRSFLIPLVIASLLAIYAISVFGEVCDVDDVLMFKRLQNAGTQEITNAFSLNAASGAYYYRPIITVSFNLDRVLLGLHPGFMKFENILIHIINALLVYWLAYQLVPREKRGASLVPLVSALFFGLNPLSTESVNWISGRTDLLACLFVLLSANMLIQFKRTRHTKFLVFSVFFLILGFFTKEVSIAFVAGAFLIMSSNDVSGDTHSTGDSDKRSLSQGYYFLLLVCGVVLFEVLRRSVLAESSSRLGLTLKIIYSNIPYATFVVLNALAFYIKKIFIPFPLNFSIVEPDPLYDFIGLPLLLLCVYLISRRKILSAVFMAGIAMLTPAFLVAFKQIAWTAYAERYAYIASSFIVTASVVYGHSILHKSERFEELMKTAVVVILVVFSAVTFQRNIVWMHNITLYKDMVNKNPRNALVRAGYGFYLANDGDYQNAKTQFLLAKEELSNRRSFTHASPFIKRMLGYVEHADIGLAYVLEREGKVSAAAQAYEGILNKTRGESKIALNRLIPLYEYMLQESRTASEAAYPLKKLLILSGKKYNYADAQVLYWIGKMLLVRGDRVAAREFFQRAYKRFEKDSTYRTITKKMVNGLGDAQNALLH